jgi:crotonobetainyl-CoA:carnitine CoA-transferase CaiB-like acyl-CoA transferase
VTAVDPPAATGHTLPLAGLRVVDLTTMVAGPYATLLLVDLGADVVKVEPPRGDQARDLGPRVSAGMGAVFVNCNRGKRSVVLDLTTDAGRDALKQLTASAAGFVHNLRPDAAARCGADAETLRAGNPELVHCTIRGFGSGGRYRDLPAYDDIIQGAAGIAGAQEWVAGEPAYVANAIADKVAGLMGALAITAALHERCATGHGSTVEVPMFESLVAFGLLEHLWGRTFVPPLGEARYPRMSSPERRPYRTADGWVSVVVYTSEHWRKFFDLIGRPELMEDERYSTLWSRTQNLESLHGLLADSLLERPTDEWLGLLQEAGIPAVRYSRIDDLFDDPHLTDAGLFQHVVHPTEGELLQIATPISFDGEQGPIDRPAPQLGEHTAEILGELGIAGG